MNDEIDVKDIDVSDFEFSKEIEESLRKQEEYREKTKNVSIGEY